MSDDKCTLCGSSELRDIPASRLCTNCACYSPHSTSLEMFTQEDLDAARAEGVIAGIREGFEAAGKSFFSTGQCEYKTLDDYLKAREGK